MSLKGHVHSNETKAKISQSLKGRMPWTHNKKLSQEIRAKISRSLKGHVVSNETREKISKAMHEKIPVLKEKLKASWADPEKRNFRLKVMESKEYKSKISSASKKMWNGIEFREARSGENSSMWMGGKSFEPYCPKFNAEFKTRVREFFNDTCVMCGDKPTDYKLHVHHINYNKLSCCDSTTPMFATLCRKCHAKTSTPILSKREKYEADITKIINDNYSGFCFYTKKDYYGDAHA